MPSFAQCLFAFSQASKRGGCQIKRGCRPRAPCRFSICRTCLQTAYASQQKFFFRCSFQTISGQHTSASLLGGRVGRLSCPRWHASVPVTPFQPGLRWNPLPAFLTCHGSFCACSRYPHFSWSAAAAGDFKVHYFTESGGSDSSIS